MLSHRHLSAWYHQLAQQLEAGLPFAEAVRAAHGTGMPAAGLAVIAAQIEAGGSIAMAFAAGDRWLPQTERLVLSAAADTGRLPQTLHRLSGRHAQLAAMHLRLLLACAYPLAVLHLGLVLLPISGMIDWDKGFTWDTLRYLRALASSLGPLWIGTTLVFLLVRRRNAAIGQIARRLPFIGGYLRAQGLSDFAFALANLLDAGVPIDRAWASAGATTALPNLAAAAQAVGAVIARGDAPGAMLATLPAFPADFAAMYRTGETAGQLDTNLSRLATEYQERAGRSLTLASLFYPALMFIAVAIAVAVNVLKIYAGYLKMIEKMAS